MKAINIFITIIAVAAASCGSKPAIDFGGEYADDKPFEVVDVDLQPVLVDTVPLCPWNICFLDSLLVVEEYWGQVKSNFFKVYKDGKLVAQFGQSGNGPDDFDGPNLVSAGRAEHGCFRTIESGRLKMISIGSADYQPSIQTFIMPDGLSMPNEVFLNNDTAVAVSQSGGYQMECYDKRAKSTKGYNFFEEAGKFDNFNNYQLANELYPFIGSSNGKYAVWGYYKMKMIDIVSLSDMTLHKRICFRGYDRKKFEISSNGDFVFDKDIKPNYFCTFIVAGDDSFFALMWDLDRTSGNLAGAVYELSYDGFIIRQYTTSREISSFVIKGKEMYAISSDENGERIICKGNLQ